MKAIKISNTISNAVVSSIDAAKIARYNSAASPDYRLHPELGPSCFEGDIDSAPVVLLLANPGYDKTSTPDDHTFSRPGWPLAGLHPEAPPGLREWWRRRLKDLINLYGDQYVSQRIACLQITPWASNGFDDQLRLPSRQLILGAANQIARREAMLIVMRAERLWLEAEAVRASPSRHRVKSWRCSYVSEGNLGIETWKRVVEAIAPQGLSIDRS